MVRLTPSGTGGFGRWISAGRDVARAYARHRGSVLAAGFAYFALFSLVPAAIALGGIAGLVLDPSELREALERAVERVPSLEGSASEILGGLLDVVERTGSPAFGLTTVIATAVAVFAASRVVVAGSSILDVVFDRAPRERSWLVRIAATGLVLVVLVGSVLLVIVAQSLPRLQEALGIAASLGGADSALLIAGALAATTVIMGWAYRLGAPAGWQVRVVGPGALTATAVVTVGTIATAVYVAYSGALGAAVAVLGGALVVQFWLYLVGVGLVLGAEVEARRASVSTSGTTHR